jgi:hypothetical protein
VTPELAAPGRTTAVLVTLHGPDASQATNVTLRLVSDRVEEVTQLLAEVSQEIRGKNLYGSETGQTRYRLSLPWEESFLWYRNTAYHLRRNILEGTRSSE